VARQFIRLTNPDLVVAYLVIRDIKLVSQYSTAQRMVSQGLLKTTHRKEVSAVSPTPRLPTSSCLTTGTVSCLALMVD